MLTKAKINTELNNIIRERSKSTGWSRYIFRWGMLFGILSIVLNIMPKIAAVATVSDVFAWVAAAFGLLAIVSGMLFFVSGAIRAKNKGQAIENRIVAELSEDNRKDIESTYGKFYRLNYIFMPVVAANMLAIVVSTFSNFLLVLDSSSRGRDTSEAKKILLTIAPLFQIIVTTLNYFASESISIRNEELRKVIDNLNTIPEGKSIVEHTETLIATDIMIQKALEIGKQPPLIQEIKKVLKTKRAEDVPLRRRSKKVKEQPSESDVPVDEKSGETKPLLA